MNATEELHYIDSFQKVDEVVERVASIRERFGDAMDIGVDFHGLVHKPMAKVLAKAWSHSIQCFWKKSFYLKMKNTLKK